MKEIIEIIKARWYCEKFNIYTEEKDSKRKSCMFLGGDYIYKGVLYFGHPLLIFFVSAHNSWYKKIATTCKCPKCNGANSVLHNYVKRRVCVDCRYVWN